MASKRSGFNENYLKSVLQEEIKKGTKKLVSNSDDRKEPIKKNGCTK